MRKTFLLILLSILSLSTIRGVDTALIQEKPFPCMERIEKYQHDIKGMVEHREYYRKIFAGVKAGLSALNIAQTAIVIGGLVSSFFGYSFLPVGLTCQTSHKKWFADHILLNLGSMGSYFLHAQLENKYGTPSTIRWIVVAKAPFYVTLRHLYFLSQELLLSKNPEQIQAEMQKMFTHLERQTEYIIGYMSYRRKNCSLKNQKEMEQLIAHLTARADTIFTDIKQLMNNGAINIQYHFDSIMSLLEGDCARFARLEQSHWINPSAILDMMQIGG